MTLDAWILAGILLVMFAALVSSRIAVDLVMLGTLTLLVVLGLVEGKSSVSGFGNEGLITVGLLYIMAAGLKETGAINLLTAKLLGRPKTVREAQLRLVLPVAFLSAFANNTPIVTSFLPVIDATAKRCGLPATKLYMPLSFAAILGGLCTLIGTSTTLIVAGLIIDHNSEFPTDPQLTTFSMFTIAKVGVPVAIAGVLYILLVGRRLLPEPKEDPLDPEDSRQYMTAMRVEPGSPIIGKTIEKAGLRSLPGLYLSRIDRLNTTVIAVGPDEIIQQRDVLVFVGILDSVMDLQKIRGITPVASDSEHTDYRPSMRTVEAVVSNSSPLVGQTIRDANIRSRYGAVVVAVNRQGHRLMGKVGDIRLLSGDTLLLEAAANFAARHRHSKDFHLVSEISGASALRHDRAWISISILLGLVVALTFGIPPVAGALAAATLTILLRCCTGPQARDVIDWSVLFVIGAAFGIGHAMQTTGLADVVANGLIGVAGQFGPVAILAAVYVLTVLFTMFITNNAAAVLMFPIAYATSQSADMSFQPIAVCIAVAASAEFSTPIGYQTNLIVMGPGGYKWFDYTRFGGPLTIIAGIICVTLASSMYGPLSDSPPETIDDVRTESVRMLSEPQKSFDG